MMVRERFENDLQDVQEAMLELSTKAIDAFELAFKAFVEKDMDLALEIIEMDKDINRLEEAINDRVILLIAKQQPVATDLRRLIVMIKASADMERVGDYAVNIAKETIRMGKDPFITPIETLEDMHFRTASMLRQIVKAFIEENTAKAKEIADLDDQVDELYGDTVSNLMRLSSVQTENLSQITYLSFIARYIERCADHATNIAEHLFYLVKGHRYELNN
jgi:phosphate transport system protein